MKIARIELAEECRDAYIALLCAFQRTFPSCAGPSLEQLDDPALASQALTDEEGAVEARYERGELWWTDLVSAARARRFRWHRLGRLGGRVELILDSSYAAAELLGYLPPDLRLLVWAPWDGDVTGRTVTALELLERLQPHVDSTCDTSRSVVE